MFSYKYKLVGMFFEDGQRINSIQEIPKRKHDPVFSGIINIMEDSWRIHSLQLVLTKDAQIDFVDTLRINQLFVPIDKDIWFQFSNKFTFTGGTAFPPRFPSISIPSTITLIFPLVIFTVAVLIFVVFGK